MSKAWASGSDRKWRRTRTLVLQRDGYRCQMQGPGCLTVATHVNHKLGKGVSEALVDLEAACSWCNQSAGSPRANDPAPRPSTQW